MAKKKNFVKNQKSEIEEICGHCMHHWPAKCIIMGHKIPFDEEVGECPYFELKEYLKRKREKCQPA